MGMGSRLIGLFAFSKPILESFSACWLWIGTDAIVEATFEKAYSDFSSEGFPA